jgi:hypothetical protein
MLSTDHCFWLSHNLPIRVLFLPHSCYMPRPPLPSRLDHSNYTWRRVQITMLLVIQFSPFSRHLIHLQSKFLLSTLFSNTLSLCSSLNARDQVSHPYRSTGKIIVLYILILALFDSRREDRRFWTESNLYFNNYFDTVSNGPALYTLLTFRVLNLISMFCCLGRLSKESVQVRASCQLFATCPFCNKGPA